MLGDTCDGASGRGEDISWTNARGGTRCDDGVTLGQKALQDPTLNPLISIHKLCMVSS